MFKANVMMKEFEQYSHEIFEIINKIECSKNPIPFTEFDKMPCISIDYAIMEKVIILQW